jgi:hypothetical protein
MVIKIISFKGLLTAMLFFLLVSPAFAQTTQTFNTGAYIVNMGVTPQTVGNGLKPYGMIYDLIKNFGVPISWVIDPNKTKDGIDFSHNGIDYRGGPFIIPAEYRTATVNARIAFWNTEGVIGATSVSPLLVPVFKTITVNTAPDWTLDQQSGSIVAGYFVNAGIPPGAHGGASSNGWKTPAQLNECDDVFAMPHADPVWASHSNLLAWNLDHKGAIWTACHSGSALELMFNPANPAQQGNFLTNKTGIAGGGGPWATPSNSLIIWKSHGKGTPPYAYNAPSDPVMQFMGILDAATLNGSEQIYIPVQAAGGGWLPTTVLGVYDPDHPETPLANPSAPEFYAAVIAYGHGFGDTERGLVMYEGGHSHNKGALPANIAAQRAFFNFSLIAAKAKAPDPEVTVDLSNVFSGTTNSLDFQLLGDRDISEFTILWESDCGGTFSSTTTQATVFTAPVVTSPTQCLITITLTDGCNRVYRNSTAFTIKCDFDIVATLTTACGSNASGAIDMAITNADAPFVYSWNRTAPTTASGSGTGTSITGLEAGTYSVTVTPNNGAGCPKTFITNLPSAPEVTFTPVVTNIVCPGGTNGVITINMTGGTPPFTYDWDDLAGPNNPSSRTNLSAGNYELTVTDAKGCSATQIIAVNEPDPIALNETITPVLCFGANNGQIAVAPTGGNGPYTYLWSDGSTQSSRTNLPPGTYSVTVRDANNCTATFTSLEITQPAAALAATHTQTNLLCFGGTSGEIDLTVTGGTSPYTYAWTGPGGPYATEDLTGLVAGTYSVVVTDDRGCTTTRTVTLTQPAALSVSGVRTNPSCPPGAQQNDQDGAIVLTVSGGTLGYSFAWTASNGGLVPSGQENNQNLTNLRAGTYQVVVTDANNCTRTVSFTLTNQFPNPATPGNINN